MKHLTMMLLMVFSLLVVALGSGCSTERGGTSDEFNTISNNGEAHPQPAGSPTQRPGMNPQDPRDPQFNTRPDMPQP